MAELFPNARKMGHLDMYARILAGGEVVNLGEINYGDDRLERSTFRCTSVPLAANLLAVIFVNVTREKRAEALLEQQSETIQILSTPVIELWEGIVLLPLIGSLDADRGSRMIERLLHAVAKHQSRVAILDITGLTTMDAQAARDLVRAAQAAKLLGVEVILTGISPALAVAMVELGVDSGQLQTHRSLHQGVSVAFRSLGLSLTRRS